jgi:hypothetical protein
VEILGENVEVGAGCTLWLMNPKSGETHRGISRLVRNTVGKYGAYDKFELNFSKPGLNLKTLRA